MTLDQSLEDRRHAVDASDDHDDFLTATIADQLIGVPVLTVQDVLGFRTVAPIPMAPPEVAGSINLRGRIVTVVDLRARLGLPPRPDDMSSMNFVVDHEGELYSLMVDTVGEVLSVTSDRFEANPATIDRLWRDYAKGVYRLDGQLMVVLYVDRLLAIDG